MVSPSRARAARTFGKYSRLGSVCHAAIHVPVDTMDETTNTHVKTLIMVVLCSRSPATPTSTVMDHQST